MIPIQVNESLSLIFAETQHFSIQHIKPLPNPEPQTSGHKLEHVEGREIKRQKTGFQKHLATEPVRPTLLGYAAVARQQLADGENIYHMPLMNGGSGDACKPPSLACRYETDLHEHIKMCTEDYEAPADTSDASAQEHNPQAQETQPRDLSREDAARQQLSNNDAAFHGHHLRNEKECLQKFGSSAKQQKKVYEGCAGIPTAADPALCENTIVQWWDDVEGLGPAEFAKQANDGAIALRAKCQRKRKPCGDKYAPLHPDVQHIARQMESLTETLHTEVLHLPRLPRQGLKQVRPLLYIAGCPLAVNNLDCLYIPSHTWVLTWT